VSSLFEIVDACTTVRTTVSVVCGEVMRVGIDLYKTARKVRYSQRLLYR
jgi:hypothetical protein